MLCVSLFVTWYLAILNPANVPVIVRAFPTEHACRVAVENGKF